MRKIWQKKWIRWSLWLTSVGCIAGTMVWLVSRLPDKPIYQAAGISIISQKTDSPLKAHQKAVNPTEATAVEEKPGPEWCETSTKPPTKHLDPVFDRFRTWLDDYGKSGGIPSRNLEKAGVRLAKERSGVLKKLLQVNPRLALSQIVPARIRERLPIGVRTELAEIVSGVGDLNVLHACFGPSEGYRQTIYRTLRMRDGRKFNVSAYGQRALFQEKIGLSVLGAAIDGELALLDSPARILGVADVAERKLPASQTYVEACGKLLAFGSREEAVNRCRRIRKMETRGGKILNYDLFQTSGQTVSQASYQYQVLDVNLTWEQARFVARALGGDLAEIEDDEDNETVKKLIDNVGRTSAWIGPDENRSVDLDGHGGNAPRGYVVEFPPTPSFATVNADADSRTVRIMVVRARYKNQDTEKVDGLKGNFSPITSDDLHRQMNATRTFYLRESNGKCRIDYNASGTVTLPEDNEFYNWIAANEGRGAAFGYLTSHALASAAAQGYDFTGYDKFIIVTTEAHTGYGGLGGGSFAHCPAWTSGVIIHELGHCFGLPHANQWVAYGENPISDEGFEIDYGNPMSIMGGKGHRESADDVAPDGAEESEGSNSFTLWAKDVINTNDPEGFYRTGNFSVSPNEIRGIDIIEVEKNTTNAAILDSKLALSDSSHNSFFRIYHHDYDLTDEYLASLPTPQQEFLREQGIAPWGLKEGTFLIVPDAGIDLNASFDAEGNFTHSGRVFTPEFRGTGNDVNASLKPMANGNLELTIHDGGTGYCVEPTLFLTEVNGIVGEIAIRKDWIGVVDENESFHSVSLLAKSDWNSTKNIPRGLRGIIAPAVSVAPVVKSQMAGGVFVDMHLEPEEAEFEEVDAPGDRYWIGFRREFSRRGLTFTLSNLLLDMTRETQEKYHDGALTIGRTYSDYGSDLHVTPIRHGGTYPMEYIDVVVRYKTDDNNSDPVANLNISKRAPAVGETVELSATVASDDDNDTEFAYAWFVNDVMLEQDQFLNKSAISIGFDKVGYHKVRVEVSDMKGGVCSITQTVAAGSPQRQNYSTIEGRVLGAKGEPVRGLRVVAQKAVPILHQVKYEGSASDNNVKRYFIDGEEAPDLTLYRGQWHRFILESSVESFPLSFNKENDRTPLVVRPRMSLRFYIEENGTGYPTRPKVTVDALYDESNQSVFVPGTEWHDNNVSDKNVSYYYGNSPPSRVLQMPGIETILYPTKVEGVTLLYGGQGFYEGESVTVILERNATWHTYHPFIPPNVAGHNATIDGNNTDANLVDANVSVLVDGIGTITIEEKGDGYLTDGQKPSVAVVGRGSGVEGNMTLGGRIYRPGQSKVSLWENVQDDEVSAVDVIATGLGFDSNTTFAALVYPPDPKAYWSFDKNTSGVPSFLPGTPNWTPPTRANLAHRWKFDELENNGTTFFDSAGDNNFTEWKGAPKDIGAHNLAAGIHGKAADFNGSGDNKFTTTKSFDPNDGLTVSLWVQVDGDSPVDDLIMQDTNFKIRLGPGGKEDLDLFINGASVLPTNPYLPTSNVFGSDKWTHVALTHGDLTGTSNGTWRLYVNGDLVLEQPTTTNFSAKTISIGSLFKGAIDEVEIYTRGLTEAEVRELAGLYVLDFSGNGNHGVLIDGNMSVSVSGGQAKVLDALDLNGTVYADFYPAIGNLNSLTHGSISAWFASNGRRGGNGAWEDMTIFSASDKDDNGTRLSLYMRDTGQIRFLVENGGSTILDMYTQNVFRDPNTGEADEWHHVAVTMDKNGTSVMYVDGGKQSVIYNANSDGKRAFFTDVENIDSITIGAHFGADSTKRAFFEGKLDEIYVFDRVLTTEEIQYMIAEGTSLGVYEATIKPHVDALGTFKLIDGGSGYRSVPVVTFGPPTPSSEQGHHRNAGVPGREMEHMHHRFDTDGPSNRWSHITGRFPDPRGTASLVPTSVEDLGFVDGTGDPYVDVGLSRSLPANTAEHGMLAQSLSGFRVRPSAVIEPSPSTLDADAFARGIFFIPEGDAGIEIISPGSGFREDGNSTASTDLYITGRGGKPPRFRALMEPDPHHDGFLRMSGIEMTEKGYGPYDNNTTYLEIVYVGGDESPTYFLHPDFITGGDVAAPPNSRYQGLNLYDLGKPNTWPARIQVNVSTELDVEEGRATAKGEWMSMEVVQESNQKHRGILEDLDELYNYGPPTGNPIEGGVGYREAPVFNLEGLLPTHRLEVNSTVLHRLIKRVSITDQGRGYRTPLEVRWHGGYGPEHNASTLEYPSITNVVIYDENGSAYDENGSLIGTGEPYGIFKIDAEVNATTYIPRWQSLHLSITGAGGRNAYARVSLHELGGPWIEYNGSKEEMITDYFGRAFGGLNAITEVNATRNGFPEWNASSRGSYYDGIYGLLTFDDNNQSRRLEVIPHTEWIALNGNPASTELLSGLIIEGQKYFWTDDEHNESHLFRFIDNNHTHPVGEFWVLPPYNDPVKEEEERGQRYFDGNLSIRPIEGNSTAALMIEVTSSGYGYLPPGDANTTLADRFVLGSEVNATVEYGGLPPDANATFKVKLGGGIKAISVNAQKAGYGWAVSPSISVSGDGTGALLHPVVKGGRVVDVVVEDPGSGYNTATLTVSGGGATTVGGWPAGRRPRILAGNPDSVMNATLKAVLVDGKISRVLIENPGWNYFQPEIVVTGTGSGVEAIPVFERNDTRRADRYYLDYVLVTNPGSGFTEEPWLYQRPEVHMFDYATFRDAPDANTTATIRNWGNPTYVKNTHYPMFQPRLVASLADNFGDRVMEVEITDPGSFHQKGDLNATLSLKHGRAQDGRQATGYAVFDRVVKSITLKDPKNEAVFIPNTDVKMLGTYGYDKDGNMTTDGALVVDLCSTYLERPEIKVRDTADFGSMLQDESEYLTVIPGNDNYGRDFNQSAGRNYVDVFVDGDTPDEFFYHLRGFNGPDTGGMIQVHDAVPYAHWWHVLEWEPMTYYAAGQVVTAKQSSSAEGKAYEAIMTHFSGGSFAQDLDGGMWRNVSDNKDLIDGRGAVLVHDEFYLGTGMGEMVDGHWGILPTGVETYTDSDGYYTFPDLDAGLYNVAVFHENQYLRTIVHRSSSDGDDLTQTVPLAGLDGFVLEASGIKDGNCTLIWSGESILLADRGSSVTSLKGVGFGFREEPVLLIEPDEGNTGQGTLKLDVSLSGEGKDGRLDLTVTSAAFHDRGDKYYIHYRTTVPGVDFWLDDWNYTETEPHKLIISPDSAANAVETLIFNFSPGDETRSFEGTVWDVNANIVIKQPLTWSWRSDFNESSTQDSAEVATLTGSGPADHNKSATATLTLYSTLRKGRLLSVDILDGGQGYAADDIHTLVFAGSNGKGAMARIAEVNASTGAITRIEVLDRGEGYIADGLTVRVENTSGAGADLRPVAGSGRITIRVELDSNKSIFAEADVVASGLHVVEENATLLWLDRYFGTFNSGTVDMSADPDGDGLTNQQELGLYTNPNWLDSDGDGLNDFNESQTLGTNPLLADTDGDGLSDMVEFSTIYDNNVSKTTDALLFDTDGDGWSDGLEVTFGLDPTQENREGAYVSGYIYFSGDMSGKLYVTALPDSNASPAVLEEGKPIAGPYQTFDPAAATYYFFSNLPTNLGIPYKLLAFIDRNGSDGKQNQVFDHGEPSGIYAGTWDGLLSGNRDGITFTVTDPPPNLVLLPMADGNKTVYLNPGDEEFHLKPYASDDFDGEISAKDIKMGGNATEVITITEINATQGSGTLKVADSAPTGVYLMVYSASDKAGSVGTAERHFVITDKLPPVLTLSGESVDIHEAGTEWIDPGVTAIDAVDGNLTAEVEVSGSVESALKTYYLIYAVTDKSGNQAITTRTVIVVDTMPPVLTLYGSDTVNLNKGEPFIDSGFAAEDAYDGDLAAAVNVSGLEALDVNVSGAYVISYKVWDSSNLFAEANRTIYVEDWNYTIAGKAMDGYLVGASVVFDIDGNGTHDLSKPVTTDENGGFTLAFTKEEFAKVDINQNGIIDFDEGRIRVFGGEDSSTLAPFAGLYVADANSTVVNPLTTLATALVDQGLSREEAKGKVAEALGVPESVDVFSYDLIAAASEGDASSGATLAASARVANAIRQTSAFMQYVSDSAADEKNVSALLVAEVAKNMANGEAVSLGDATQMKDVLEAVVESAGYTSYLTAADLDGASQLLVSADELILESQANNSQPTALASDLAKIQAVVEGGIVWGYENGDTPATLAEIKTKELLAGQKESYSNVNVFPPKAADAEAFLPSDLWSGEAVVHVIGGTDADGDGIQYSIDSGNPDADQDGKAAFSVNANGQLMVEDPDELASIPGGVVSLGVRMADGQGLYGTATVTIRLGNALALETVTVEEAGWRLSAWLGHFYANTASWIYHESLGWLYVSRDGSDGYWLWSANQNAWLWTSSGAHPYFYKYTAGWLYLDVAGSRKMYDFATGQWMDP